MGCRERGKTECVSLFFFFFKLPVTTQSCCLFLCLGVFIFASHKDNSGQCPLFVLSGQDASYVCVWVDEFSIFCFLLQGDSIQLSQCHMLLRQTATLTFYGRKCLTHQTSSYVLNIFLSQSQRCSSLLTTFISKDLDYLDIKMCLFRISLMNWNFAQKKSSSPKCVWSSLHEGMLQSHFAPGYLLVSKIIWLAWIIMPGSLFFTFSLV